MTFITDTSMLFNYVHSYILEINLKKYSNTDLGAVSSAGRALPF